MSDGTLQSGANGLSLTRNYDERILRTRDAEYTHLQDNIYLNNAERVPCARSLAVQPPGHLTADFLNASKLPASRVDAVRLGVLEYFKADPKHFDVILTPNATEAVKLVMQSCQEHKFRYLYHKESHNDLVGIREVARGGSRCLRSDREVEDWLENGDNTEKGVAHDGLLLFSYPAQSNITGRRLPLSWPQRLRRSKVRSHRKSYTLLDASTYLVTARLDLSDADTVPDFISFSLNTIFGLPDLGALLVRKSAGRVLTARRYFSAATVELVLDLDEQTHIKKGGSIHSALEDAALPTQSVLALERALKLHKMLFGSADDISLHTQRLIKWLHSELTFLRHFTGTRVVQIYNEEDASYDDSRIQGPMIAFNIRDANRKWISATQFEKLANACGIQLYTGGIPNSGGLATMLDLKPWEMIRNFYEQLKCGKDYDVIGDVPTGIVRVSLGPMTTMKDVMVFATFMKTFFVQDKAWQPKSALVFFEYFEMGMSSAGAEDSFEEAAPEEEETLGMMIQPIEGCNPCPLTQQHETAHQTESAFRLWNREWCILKKATSTPIDPATLELQYLQISLLPERGFLKATSLRDLTVPTADGRDPAEGQAPRGMGNILKIDLWASPPQCKTSEPLEDGRIADPYPQSEISAFFTAALNVPCTLARYRPSQSIIQARRRTCVVPKCRLELANSSLLAKHYKEHAEDFDKEKRKLSKKEKEGRPPVLTLSPPTGEGGLTRSKSLFRSNSRRQRFPSLSPELAQSSRPFIPAHSKLERNTLDDLCKEVGDMGLSPVSESHGLKPTSEVQRSKSRSKGGLLRSLSSLSKRHVNGPVPFRAPNVRNAPPANEYKSLESLNAFPFQAQHDRVKSEGVPTKTPLITAEDVDTDSVGKGLRPEKAGWVKRHLSVRTSRDKWQSLKS